MTRAKTAMPSLIVGATASPYVLAALRDTACDNYYMAIATPTVWREALAYCTALIMSKIGRYIATTMPPTTTPSSTIITGSISESSPDTAVSTSVS